MRRYGSVCGRLAPSPTGYLHLGNAWAFLLAWLAVRKSNGILLLRIENIDPQRSRAEFSAALQEDLRWLGLDWDYGPDSGGQHAPYEQSKRGRLADVTFCFPRRARLRFSTCWAILHRSMPISRCYGIIRGNVGKTPSKPYIKSVAQSRI